MTFTTNPKVVSDEELQKVIERIYCTRFFRKRPTPSQALFSSIRNSLLEFPSPLRLFFLWGVHGKPCVEKDDLQALDYLLDFLNFLSIRLAVKNHLTIVVCDTHGAINKVNPKTAEEYASQVEVAIIARGLAVLRMSDLWLHAGISHHVVDSMAETLNVEVDAPRLLQFAHRYYLGQDVVDGASRYLAARLLEKSMLTKMFQGAIHVTPVEPSLQFLQPELPEFYVWIKKRGCSVKPWFPVEKS